MDLTRPRELRAMWFYGKEAHKVSIKDNYKDNNKKFNRFKACMQKHLFSYFSSTCYNVFLNVSVTNPKSPLKLEDWRKNWKTMAPYGLNIEEGAWLILRVF